MNRETILCCDACGGKWYPDAFPQRNKIPEFIECDGCGLDYCEPCYRAHECMSHAKETEDS
jgi:hypothetical protein